LDNIPEHFREKSTVPLKEEGGVGGGEKEPKYSIRGQSDSGQTAMNRPRKAKPGQF
jgi:hypothetical protein